MLNKPEAEASIRRFHDMPFGAQLEPDGRVRFQLWAPDAARVDLCLKRVTGDEIQLPMEGKAGWFTLTTGEAGVGSLYRYCIDGCLLVPDPASRFQPNDVAGASQVLDPASWSWTDGEWRGRPWEEAVIYELHVGTFSTEGSFDAVKQRLEYLVELGITVIQLMPVADFPGKRGWGYDGVLLFAPDSSYGRPESLKSLVQAAHEYGLMVVLDVVYNHFGPEGNYLYLYASDFFSKHHHTPWGKAINFDGKASSTVREFFIHNALYWLEEYHLDGLRLDAVHAIKDDSYPDILQSLAAAIYQGPGTSRYVHLILENDHNAAYYLRPDTTTMSKPYRAQWNDDLHHAFHCLLTGEEEGYYVDYASCPVWYLGRCLAEGFGYQGEASLYRNGSPRGEPSKELPPTAFISFLQNHDQVGNRALGERMAALADEGALHAALAVILLAPSPPMLFMGEEFASTAPFQFFCDFEGPLAKSITEGRCREFSAVSGASTSEVVKFIPDPNAVSTYNGSKLDWDSLLDEHHQEWLRFYKQLLSIRRQHLVPILAGARGSTGDFCLLSSKGLWVRWRFADGAELSLVANLGNAPVPYYSAIVPRGQPLYLHPPGLILELAAKRLPPWSVAWFLQQESQSAGAL